MGLDGRTGDGGGTGPGTTHSLRSGPAPLSQYPQNAASQPIRARSHVIYCKVSQNGQVSTKYPEKACHSPYIQNRLGKSPLEILRFPFSESFSHKELMGHF